MVLISVYLVCAIVSISELILFVTSSENRLQDTYIVTIVALIAITNFGYFFISTAQEVNTAILANKIAYIGGVWIPLCTFMVAAKFCGVKIHPAAIFSLTAVNFVLFFLTMTTGYSDIYYVTSWIENINGVTVLKNVYGPAHIFFYVMLCVETGLSILVTFYACVIKHKSVPLKIIMLTLLAILLPRLVYFIRKIFVFDVEIMPIAYTITGTLFLFAYGNMNLYDITLLLAKSHSKSNDHGFIAFDVKKRLVSFNDTAADFFPVLKTSRINSPVDESSLLHKVIVSFINDIAASDSPDGKIHHNDVKISEKLFLKVNVFSFSGKYKFNLFSSKYYLVELVDNTVEHNYISMQENFNSLLQSTLNKQLAHIKAVHDSVVRSMSFIIANRDGSTGKHVKHTSMSVKIFLEALQSSPMYSLSKSFCENIEKAAPLHDIGKIGVDDAILKKPGKFSSTEYDIMKMHPEIGAEIIDKVFAETEDEEFKIIAKNVAHYHHERWDGNGYPSGLRGEEIPLEARIMALPDVFDALVCERVYKKPYSYDEAFSIIIESIDTQFDPALGGVFLSIRPKLIEMYENLGAE